MSTSSSSLSISAGFFFQRGAARPWLADPLGVDRAAGELAAALADGLAVQAEQGGGAAVAAVAAQQGGEAGEQAPLLLVKQAQEQGEGGGQAGRDGAGRWRRGQGLGAGGMDAAGVELALAAGRVGGAVDRLPLVADTGELVGAGELGEGVDGADAEQGVEFGGAEAEGGVGDQGAGGGAEGALGGEADAVMGPQAAGVKARQLAQGVEAAAVGVAGEAVELLELAEDGAGGGGSEGGGELGQGGDGLAAQEVGQGAGREGCGSHEAIMSVIVCINSVILTQMQRCWRR